MTFEVCITQHTQENTNKNIKIRTHNLIIIIVSKHYNFSCDELRAYKRYFDDEREDQERFEKKGRDDKSKEREENLENQVFLIPKFLRPLQK